MIPLIPILSKLSALFPLVRRKTLENAVTLMEVSLGANRTSMIELRRTRKLLGEADSRIDSLVSSNDKLRETVLGAKNVGRFRKGFQPGHSQTSSTSRFGAKPPSGDDEPLVDSGSVAALTAVALRKFNEVILLQSDFEAMAMSADTLEFILAGEKWHVEFTRKVEN